MNKNAKNVHFLAMFFCKCDSNVVFSFCETTFDEFLSGYFEVPVINIDRNESFDAHNKICCNMSKTILTCFYTTKTVLLKLKST